MSQNAETVTLTIDGKTVTVPKGTNLIEAAKQVGVEVPHYCYHPHLSIAGNCRMCQVHVKGRPKLEIACNTAAIEGMEVATHISSKEVADAQAATLEFILVNHPLDCTVCDQAGHCKLQDYHFEYNARPSRFLEEKEHKVKAEPLGPTVMLDGERCIMCTRCIRFCDEITKTSELGMLNRGDRSVIAVSPDRPLNNPLSGTVVDLCPVGALTHREWRFNTRIWFTKQTDAICPGCSTGCNVRAAVRDGEVVQVKARQNPDVNKEWLCDEGRYGFMRFLPSNRIALPRVRGNKESLGNALQGLKGLGQGKTIIFAACDMLTEEYALLKRLVDGPLKNAKVVVSYRERQLNEIEKILVSPDYAPNYRGAEYVGLVSGDLHAQYRTALEELTKGTYQNVLVVGDRGILPGDCTPEVLSSVAGATLSAATLCDAAHPIAHACQILFGGRSILEKAGVLINRAGRAQYTDKITEAPEGSHPEWRIFNELSRVLGSALMANAQTDRDATMWFLSANERLEGESIRTLKQSGVVAA